MLKLRPFIVRSAAVLAAYLVVGAGDTAAGMIDKTGMKSWEVCGLCHGLNGISHMQKFPRLAGQDKAYIEKQLRDFRASRRMNDGGQMAAIVTEFDEKDIPEIAEHFAKSQAPEPVTENIPDGALKSAREIFENGHVANGLPACRGCHIPDSQGVAVGPRITSQHPGYLAKQLRDFRSGDRSNDASGSMNQIAGKLTDTEIDVLAMYIASLPRWQP